MKRLFAGVNEVLSVVERHEVKKGLQSLLSNLKIREQIRRMQCEFSSKVNEEEKRERLS